MPMPAKRSDQRHGHRTKAEQNAISKSAAGKDIRWPHAGKDWHKIAKDWYQSLKVSGQAHYYEQSDVALAVYIAEAMSRNLKDGKFSAMLFSSVITAMNDLLTTETARRRAKIELQRAMDEDETPLAELHILEGYDDALEA